MNKNILMLPVIDGGISKGYSSKHIGVDFGWDDTNKMEVVAVQDGKCVDKGYNNSLGNYIVLKHDYGDGTHRFTGYIHLRQPSGIKINDDVNEADVIGYKGNTGDSHGVHLHIYVSGITSKSYTWNTMKSLCTFDPVNLFYRSPKINYNKDSSLNNFPLKPTGPDYETKYKNLYNSLKKLLNNQE